MAGLVTAWKLSEGDWRQRYDSITVYQRGWRLGGKGASSRGRNARIEEHGLHMLLGYYHETFDVMRACYEELDRPRTSPDCPITTWDQAIAPSTRVGLLDRTETGWVPWVTDFSVPSTAFDDNAIDRGPLRVVDVVRRSLRLLVDFHRLPPSNGGIVLSASATKPGRSETESQVTAVLRASGLTAVAGAVEVVGQAADALGALASRTRLASALEPVIRDLGSSLQRGLMSRSVPERTRQLVDLVLTNLRGIVADGLLTKPEGMRSIDHLDYRDWLRAHGAHPATVDQAIIRGMYDLVFAYEGGDPARPRFAAGLGLELATRMLLGHDGALFWKMQAGMGEVIFAPLYQALADRGVEFRFFHRVDRLRVGSDGNSIDQIDVARQVDVIEGPGAYRPLVAVGGLPCWPDRPNADQLVDGNRIGTVNLESFWADWEDRGIEQLIAGRDFDQVVFAISLGMVPYVAGDLMAHSARWRDMVANVATVATQSFQLWLTEDEVELGWRGGPGVTLSGFAEPFDTWASMGHLLGRELWPEDDSPATIAYFCNTMKGEVGSPEEAAAATDDVYDNAVEFLNGEIGAIWPQSVTGDGQFRWDVLAGGARKVGARRLTSQYVRANVDPSDRYVQSLPGSGAFRLKPGDSGFRNLVVAGDWTDCGLNAGCVEAATRSGILAARAIAERCSLESKSENRR